MLRLVDCQRSDLSGQRRHMTRGAQRIRLRGITKFRSSQKQQNTTRQRRSFSERSARHWTRRILMWWRSTGGIISDRSLPRIAVRAAGYQWSSCLRALAKMNLAPGGRKSSSGESLTCTLPHSSAGSVTSSISLNSACRANESLPDTMWSITIILGGAPQKFEIPTFAKATADKEMAANVRWDLLVLGDGPLRETLKSKLSTLNLNEHVHLPGFRPYDELPVYYALANAFVHASTSEQWGLVVNEAIASGLPVIVSNRCGCVPELVNGNGFTFDPLDEQELAARLLEMASLSEHDLECFAEASRKIAARFGPERFAEGLERAATMATKFTPQRFGVMDRALLLAAARYGR